MVVHAYYPYGETRVERESLALVANGYEVDLICLQDEGEPAVEVVDGVNVYRLPVTRRDNREEKGSVRQLSEYMAFFFRALAKLAILQPRRRYAAVQLHNLPDFLVFAALVPKLMGSRVILDLHDLMPEFYAGRFKKDLNSLPARLLRLQERLSCMFADQVITVTELWRQTLIGRGVPAEKITVVMNVADEKIFQRSLLKPAQSNGHFNLFYHGSIVERYGIDLIIHAIEQLCQEIPEIHLTIHGGGEYQDELMALARNLGVEEHVSFSNQFVPTSELPQLIGRAHIGVVPYRQDVFTDGILPTKMMEYMALGIPVIAARTSAIAAYFDDDMVQFFKPEDVNDLAHCIRLLYRDRARLAQLAQNSDKFNQRYNWTMVSANYLELVDRINRG